jgi:sugar/nucleoside kinase (ribokinase family)
MTSAGVVCAGNICVDILVRPVKDIRWNTTQWVQDIRQSLGGNGANTAYALAKLGTPVRLLGMTGSDAFGDYGLGQLQSAGVDIQSLQRGSAPTATTVGLVHSNGDRAFLHKPGVSAEVFPEPIVFDTGLIEGIAHFHLANVYGLPNMRRHAGETLRRARQAGLTTSLDTGWDARGEWMPVAAPCLPHLDLIMVNAEEARMLTSESEPEAAAGALLHGGAGCVIVKLGSDGCLVVTRSSACHVPAYKVDAVDTTGAGDCFAAGFLSAWTAGTPLAESAQWANAAGALSVSQLGAVTGLLDRAATIEWMRARHET